MSDATKPAGALQNVSGTTITINTAAPNPLPRNVNIDVDVGIFPSVAGANELTGTLVAVSGTQAHDIPANLIVVALGGNNATFTFFIPNSFPNNEATTGRLYVLTVAVVDGQGAVVASDTWPQRPVE